MIRNLAQIAAKAAVLVKLHAPGLERGGNVQHALQALARGAIEQQQLWSAANETLVLKLLLRDYCMRSEGSGATNDLLDGSNICSKTGSTRGQFVFLQFFAQLFDLAVRGSFMQSRGRRRRRST